MTRRRQLPLVEIVRSGLRQAHTETLTVGQKGREIHLGGQKGGLTLPDSLTAGRG